MNCDNNGQETKYLAFCHIFNSFTVFGYSFENFCKMMRIWRREKRQNGKRKRAIHNF